ARARSEAGTQVSTKRRPEGSSVRSRRTVTRPQALASPTRVIRDSLTVVRARLTSFVLGRAARGSPRRVRPLQASTLPSAPPLPAAPARPHVSRGARDGASDPREASRGRAPSPRPRAPALAPAPLATVPVPGRRRSRRRHGRKPRLAPAAASRHPLLGLRRRTSPGSVPDARLRSAHRPPPPLGGERE